MKKKQIELTNVAAQGTKVLIIDTQSDRAIKHEVLAEQDSMLQRIDVYFVSTIEDAREYVRKYGINLAIFTDIPPNYDFVDVHMELRGESKTLETIPLIEVPTLKQYRECKALGGLFDINSTKVIENFSEIRNIILNYVRQRPHGSIDSENLLNTTSLLAKALGIRTSVKRDFKEKSGLALTEILSKYDLNGSESLLITAAEQIFFPDIEIADYKNILSGFSYELLPIIESCSSWVKFDHPPTSVGGFCITLSNYLAYQFENKADLTQFEKSVKDRPDFLKHPSIRVIDSEILNTIFSAFSNEMKKKVG